MRRVRSVPSCKTTCCYAVQAGGGWCKMYQGAPDPSPSSCCFKATLLPRVIQRYRLPFVHTEVVSRHPDSQ